MAVVGMAACSGSPQVQKTLKYEAFALQPGDLEREGVAFITPSTITGLEQDRQGVAFLFARVLEEERPAIPVTTLAETLGAINRAGLQSEYKEMFTYYNETGVLPAATLARIGEQTGRRYIAMIQLAAFSNNSSSRFRLLGVRFIQTRSASLRLFYQIWDTDNGAIAWEANQELNLAYETVAETVVTFEKMVEFIAHDLIDRLPDFCTNEEIEAGTCTQGSDREGERFSIGRSSPE